MLFSSIEYFIFFLVVFLCYYLSIVFIPKKYQSKYNFQSIILLIASYFFYAAWDINYLLLFLITTSAIFFLTILMHKISKKPYKKLLLIISILFPLSLLFIFKYTNFIIDNLNKLFENTYINPLHVILPLGISFYTFQLITYSLNIYKGKIKPEKNFIYFSLFVSFFPQLIAGPIETPSHLIPQFKKIHKFSKSNLVQGSGLFLWGLIKKIVIADRAGLFVNYIFNNYTQLHWLILIIGIFLFAIQIYGDFSGYTDMARGSAKILNINLFQNFKYPYFATSISDFWRRWHISLSNWLKNYIYIPLGGSRVNKIRWAFNIIFTFFISGIWHGAGWTFIIWGLLHGIGIVSEKIIGDFLKQKFNLNFPQIFQQIFTFIFINITWVFFRAQTIEIAFDYLHKIISNSILLIEKISILNILSIIMFLIAFYLIEKFKFIKKLLQYKKYIALITIIIISIWVWWLIHLNKDFLKFINNLGKVQFPIIIFLSLILLWINSQLNTLQTNIWKKFHKLNYWTKIIIFSSMIVLIIILGIFTQTEFLYFQF